MSDILLDQLNDQFIVIPKLRLKSTGAYVDTATVTATLYDRPNYLLYVANDMSAVAVAGLSGVTGVDDGTATGTYNIPVPNTFNPPRGGGYKLVVDAVTVSGKKLHAVLRTTVVVRES